MSGEHTKHLRFMRRIYMARYQSLYTAFKETLGDIMQPIPVDGGFHFSAIFRKKLRRNISDNHIVRLCCEQGIGVLPLSSFSSRTENMLSGLVIGFAGNNEDDNLCALETLEKILRSVLK